MAGVTTTVGPKPEDLPVTTIIIVACVCGAVVVILLIILVVLCCKRRNAQKKDYEQGGVRPPLTVVHSGQNGVRGRDHQGGFVNSGLENIELEDHQKGGVFVTDTANLNKNTDYVAFERSQSPYGGHHHPSMNGAHSPMKGGRPPNNGGQPPNNRAHLKINGGAGPQWGSTNPSVPQEQPPPYHQVNEEEQNRKNREQLGAPDNDYISPSKSRQKPTPDSFDVPDGHQGSDLKKNCSESGMSTPDPGKPKKVVYEVIV